MTPEIIIRATILLPMTVGAAVVGHGLLVMNIWELFLRDAPEESRPTFLQNRTRIDPWLDWLGLVFCFLYCFEVTYAAMGNLGEWYLFAQVGLFSLVLMAEGVWFIKNWAYPMLMGQDLRQIEGDGN